MVWGTSSGAGKSLLATALCRWARRRGIDVAPFKAQNMSNNARVVPGLDGGYGEIGSAQYFQALAARVMPSVDMNPVLLKPERDTASQVVLHGAVSRDLSPLPWRERSLCLAAAARESFVRLRQQHELIVIEGAGSPAEINLADHDYVNLGTARWAAADGGLRSVVVADIDRGGAFAHLFGTWSLLPDDLRASLHGFILNKFRGDATLLSPGPEVLQTRTGVPVLGVLPLVRDHGLPEEDGVPAHAAPETRETLRVAIVAYPRISNHDEFEPLRLVPGIHVTWARSVADLWQADWIILPGSKQVTGDLAWLRAQGMDEAIRRHAAEGGQLLGVCGGLQMLGQSLSDPGGVDGEASGDVPGLGLLPLHTRYAAPKRVAPATMRFGAARGPWRKLAGVEAAGYEIRNGVTTADALLAGAFEVLHDGEGRPLGWQSGSVMGIYAHGLFESESVVRSLFGAQVRTLDSTFEDLADLIDEHLGARLLPLIAPA